MERGEHGAEFHGPLRKLGRETSFQVLEFLREENLVLKLGTRAERNADEVGSFCPAIPRYAFDDVGGHRDGGAAHLGDETVSFCPGKGLGGPVNRDGEVMGIIPGLELPIVSHTRSPASAILFCAVASLAWHRFMATRGGSTQPDS
jgi:hypothetical protein